MFNFVNGNFESKKIEVILFIGAELSLVLKQNMIDDDGVEHDSELKSLILEIVNKSVNINVMPIFFINKLSSFSYIFESVEYKTIYQNIFSRKLFMETPNDLAYELGSLNNYKILCQNDDLNSEDIITLFK